MARDALTIGSWPGKSFSTNAFVRNFCTALEQAGCSVVDVPNPRRVDERLDVLQIHWPEQILWQGGPPWLQATRVARTLVALAQLRRRGVKVAWMVHNLRPHELRGARRHLWHVIERALPRLVDGVLTLSPATLPVVSDALPALARKPMAVVRHPLYPRPAGAPDKAAARAAHGVPTGATLFAMLGALRRYKGAEALIAAFRRLPGDDRRLVIAGRASPDLAAVLTALAAGDDRITVTPRALSDEELVALTVAADWIVLPYRDYLHSGSIVHALSFGAPVLTPNVPFAGELADQVGRECFAFYDGELTADVLAAARPVRVEPDLSTMELAAVGASARDFYAGLLSR